MNEFDWQEYYEQYNKYNGLNYTTNEELIAIVECIVWPIMEK